MRPSLPAMEPGLWADAVRVLATPLYYADEREWIDAALRALLPLVGGYAGMVAIMGPDVPTQAYCQGVAEEAFAEMLSPLLGVSGHRPRYEDPVLDLAMARTLARGITVWDIPYGERLVGVPFRETSWLYNEVMIPNDLQHTSVAMAEAGGCMGFIGTNFDDERYGPHGPAGVRAVLEALVPLFRHGLETLTAVQARQHDLFRTLDRIEVPVGVHDENGAVVHWNPAFRAAVEEAAGGRGLAAAAERLAVRAVRVARGECLAPGDGLSTTLELGERTETVRASPIVAGTFAHTACAIVTVDRVRVVIPDAEALREAYGLTPRQGEVARLVALGWTTPRIARRLAISPHTARHHVEAVLERMNLHSRKALGLRILQDFAAGA